MMFDELFSLSCVDVAFPWNIQARSFHHDKLKVRRTFGCLKQIVFRKRNTLSS
jgi:hypothetical protein